MGARNGRRCRLPGMGIHRIIPTNRAPRPALWMVVLAAGASVRLGAPKALARIRGSSLIRGTISLLAPLAGAKIIVVVPPRAARIRRGIAPSAARFHREQASRGGLSTSVRLGLREGVRGRCGMLLPVDLALLDAPGCRAPHRPLARASTAQTRRTTHRRSRRHAAHRAPPAL